MTQRARAIGGGLLAVAAVLASSSFVFSAESGPAAEPSLHDQAVALIEQLGDASFQVREEASLKLTKMGLPAMKALEEGLQHGDTEVRFRCRRILRIVESGDRAGRLKAFAADTDGKLNLSLPGWERYRKVVGGDKDSRSLFVEMQRAEWELLKTAEKNPKAAGEHLLSRCQHLQAAMRVAPSQLPVGSIATLLFVAADEKVTVPDQMGSILHSFCYQQTFRNAIAGRNREPLRKLLGGWIAISGGTWSGYQSLMLSMRYDLKEGLIPARKMLKDGAMPQHYRQYAILTIAKLGGKEDVEFLKPYLKDKSVCTTHRVTKGKDKITYQTQIRDVALATMIHLSGQDPKKFGFSRLQANSSTLFNASTMGFENDEKRNEAVKKWEAHLAKQEKKK